MESGSSRVRDGIIIFGLIILVICITGTFVVTAFINLSLEKFKRNAEMKALMAQINPHFLYNTLDSINYMAQDVGAKDISDMVSSLGNFFRYSLNNGKDSISVEKELEQVKSYLDIIKLKFKNKFDVIMDIDLNILKQKTLKLILQPLVENSIMHGFDEIEYKGKITIKGYEDKKFIYFEVSDNGLGADTDQLNVMLHSDTEAANDQSLGISNTHQRLIAYFGNGCGLRFTTNEEGGVTVTVTIRKEVI